MNPQLLQYMFQTNPQMALMFLQQAQQQRQPQQQTKPGFGSALGKGAKGLWDWYKGSDAAKGMVKDSLAKEGVKQAGQTAAGQMAPGLAANWSSLGYGPQGAIIAQTALSAKSAYDMLKGKGQWDPKDDPMGAIGRGGLALATGGLSELARPFFKKPQTQVEDGRLRKLKEQGIIPEDFNTKLTDKGRDQQVKDIEAAGGTASAFLKSGNESDLTPEEIAGYATFYEKAGKGGTLADRQARAKEALAAGAVREHHGTVDVDWKKVEKYLQTNPGASGGDIASQLSPLQSAATNYSKNEPYKPGTSGVNIGNALAQYSNQMKGGGVAKVPAGMQTMAMQALGQAPQLGQAKPMSGLTSGLSFDNNSSQYKALSKDQKNEYWKLRNQGI